VTWKTRAASWTKRHGEHVQLARQGMRDVTLHIATPQWETFSSKAKTPLVFIGMERNCSN